MARRRVRPPQARRSKETGASLLQIDAQLVLPMATVQMVRIQSRGAFEQVYHDARAHWIDLCLTNRAPDARGSYSAHWGKHRYEHLGPMFMAPRGEALHVRSRGGEFASIACRVDAAAMQAWLETDMEWTERRLEASLDIANAAIRALLRKLAHEMRYPGLASQALTELLAGQVAIEVGRHFGAIDAPAATGGLAPWRLKLIDERIAELSKAPTISELAALCSMSPRHLARAFRASRGSALGEFILQTRIDTAKRLLAGDESITAIATQLGFSSLASFSFAFRRGAGVSPTQFRARAFA